MKILVTGKNGFIARNFIEYFSKSDDIVGISHNESDEMLEDYCKNCDFVVHLAAVQRSDENVDFIEGNTLYTKKIINYLESNKRYIPILFTSSIGIDKKSIFSDTKKEAESLIRMYAARHQTSCYIFKLNHIFGKYGKPNFNNVIATFCFNLRNGKPIVVNDPSVTLDFTYIDDLMTDFNKCIHGKEKEAVDYMNTSLKYRRSLGQIVMSLGNAMNNIKPRDKFEEKLFITFDSYKN